MLIAIPNAISVMNVDQLTNEIMGSECLQNSSSLHHNQQGNCDTVLTTATRSLRDDSVCSLSIFTQRHHY